jgi:hypothetical protein
MDIYERVSRIFVLGILAIAVMAAAAAPFLASQWAQQPFPGILVEETLIVNTRDGEGWTGRDAGLANPQRVVRVGGMIVTNSAEFNRAITSFQVGDAVSVFSRMPDGSAQLYPDVLLTRFPTRDLVLQFWLPYLIGLSYLGISIWMYRLRGNTRPGRAFVFFCICISIVCTVLFDVLTTHVGTRLWVFAMAGAGGALISLALRFPEEWKAVEGRPWLLGLPYLISIGLGVWAVVVLQNVLYPWAFSTARSYSYRYAVVGIIIFLVIMLFRARRGLSYVVRQQARLVLLGSLFAFAPISAWFIAPTLGIDFAFNSVLLVIPLLVFPITVMVAILRYRLLELEFIVNRTVFYGLLTAVLAGVFTVLITLTQRLFLTLTGEKNDAAIVITTVLVVAVFTPVKTRVQAMVDRQFKELPDSTRQLRGFGEEVRDYLLMNDPELISRRLLDEAVASLLASSGALILYADGQARTAGVVGRWRGEASMRLPLEYAGRRYGMLSLGRRINGEPYSQQEAAALQQVADHVARVIHLSLEGPDRMFLGAADPGATFTRLEPKRLFDDTSSRPLWQE